MLSKKQLESIKKAEEKYGKISPVGGKPEHDQKSFVDWGDCTAFLFNTSDGSTHSVKVEKN